MKKIIVKKFTVDQIILEILFLQVKLADVLNKFIVPVNFQDHWPPKCLAIQFATTQYIPWKSPEVLRQGECLKSFIIYKFISHLVAESHTVIKRK